uniref:Uncharacterized protein n=1 Tax=Arundo donax TaxID=35708 RepID=A0A0A9CQV7_ARUDO
MPSWILLPTDGSAITCHVFGRHHHGGRRGGGEAWWRRSRHIGQGRRK